LRNPIRFAAAFAIAGLALGMAAPAGAAAPSVADLDASARASGNQLPTAIQIGERVFAEPWPAQVSQISANAVGSHLIVGMRLWGVKFHHPLTRQTFVAEVVSLINQVFAVAPQTEEVDLWTSVPLYIGRGAVVSGDLAVPTSRTVFSITARRGENAASLAARALSGSGVYWDPEWERIAFRG
jgi:hypothetical protein